MFFSKCFDHGRHGTAENHTSNTIFFIYGWSIFVCQFGTNISDFYLHWVSVVCGFDHTLWFHKFWTFSWKMSLKICKDVCECICRGQGRRNKKLLVNNLWGLLRSYAIMQMVRRRRICVVIEFEDVKFQLISEKIYAVLNFPKNHRNIARISALASKMGQIKKNKGSLSS